MKAKPSYTKKRNRQTSGLKKVARMHRTPCHEGAETCFLEQPLSVSAPSWQGVL
jgi:hypothetical protein